MYVSIWILVVSEFFKFYFISFILVVLLKEGACIFTGISYDGVDEDGEPKWGALSNVYVLNFELSYTLQVSSLSQSSVTTI